MKKSLIAIGLLFFLSQAHSSERIVIDIFEPMQLCGPTMKPESQLRKCQQ
jgi:hypothetical protein